MGIFGIDFGKIPYYVSGFMGYPGIAMRSIDDFTGYSSIFDNSLMGNTNNFTSYPNIFDNNLMGTTDNFAINPEISDNQDFSKGDILKALLALVFNRSPYETPEQKKMTDNIIEGLISLLFDKNEDIPEEAKDYIAEATAVTPEADDKPFVPAPDKPDKESTGTTSSGTTDTKTSGTVTSCHTPATTPAKPSTTTSCHETSAAPAAKKSGGIVSTISNAAKSADKAIKSVVNTGKSIFNSVKKAVGL